MEEGNDSLCSSIREIPFRILANRYGLNQHNFLQLIYNDDNFKVMLANDFSDRFQIVAVLLLVKETVYIEKFRNQKRKIMSLIQKNQLTSRSYCSATEASILMLNTKFRHDEICLALCNIKPSALSKNYLNYKRVADLYFQNEGSFSSTEFIPMFPAIVDYFLHFYFDEQKIIQYLQDSLLMNMMMMNDNLIFNHTN